MPAGVTFTMEGKSYDLDDFELGELEWLEEYIGRPLMGDDNALYSMKTMVGFVFLVKKRDDPAFTVEQARLIKLNVLEPGDEAEAEGKPAKRRPTKAAPAS